MHAYVYIYACMHGQQTSGKEICQTPIHISAPFLLQNTYTTLK